MNILSIENISKSFGMRTLFENISFGIDEQDKIGLIGVNGTGKSTFLKVMAGLEHPDTGQVIVGNTVKIGYLPQNPDFDDQATVMHQVFQGNSPLMRVLCEYESTQQALVFCQGDKQLQDKLIGLTQQMEALNAWQAESDAKIILTKLGVHDFDAKVGKLSGGQRKRVALAGALINPADLLILDEPTNHIDNETVDWLEQYLNNRKGALLMITHDRYFLDRVVNRTLELDKGKLYSYSANYSKFIELKIEREEREQASENKRQNLLRNELEWIKKGAKARTTKQKARIERFEKLNSEVHVSSPGNVEITAGTTRLGKKIINLENVSKGFTGQNLIKNFNFSLAKDDRVGIIGPNGIGKSTLLNLIAGNILTDKGTVETGQTVKIGVFSQESREMNDRLRVIDYIKEVAEFIPTADGKLISASQMLEKFLFSSDLQWNLISKLSGGEKRRLFLLHVLMGAPNILLLDEPTNDLDIQTLSILEDYLDNFPGAVIVISHDRYFLDRVVDKILAFEGAGRIRQYFGNYSDYRQAFVAENQEPKTSVLQINRKKDSGTTNGHILEDKKERPLKFTYKEQKEFEEIDEMIANTELEIESVDALMNQAGSNFVLLQELVLQQKSLKQHLEHLIERWAYLNDLAEKIANNKSKQKQEE